MKLDIKTTKGTGLTDALRDFLQAQMDGLDPLVARFGESVTAEAEVGRPSGHHLKGEIQRAMLDVCFVFPSANFIKNPLSLFVTDNFWRRVLQLPCPMEVS